MKTIFGRGVSGGMASGKLVIIRHRDRTANGERCEDAECEIEKFKSAARVVAEEFDRLYKNALIRVGEREAAIFEIHKMMLEDEDYVGEVERLIKNEKKSAQFATQAAGDYLSRQFLQMDTEYMRARSEDIVAISRRVCEVIRGDEGKLTLTSDCIIAADDLSPGETIQLDRDKVKGFITERGSEMSHTAILARMMGIPAVVCVGHISDDHDGLTVIMDGTRGEVYVNPDEEILNRYKGKMQESEAEGARLERMRGKTCVRDDGVKILVAANVGDPQDIDEAVKHDAEGIGLFRSEFIFMKKNVPPSEDEQYEIYREAALKMSGHECVIRTLDVGADKKIPYLTCEAAESNPALGVRAIRLCLRMPDLLHTQFRALYRASAEGNISAMIPMICLPSEVEAVREIAYGARASLEKDGIPYGRLRVGIMIETPSAAVLSDILAPMVDFFSIGTNDLIQYTLAADRENPDVAYLSTPLPESVRRLIKMTASAGARHGIPVSVCGELGSDTEETEFLIEAGITKISVSPPHVLRVREAVMRKTGISLSRRK